MTTKNEQLALIKPGVMVSVEKDANRLMLKDYRRGTIVTVDIVRKYILAGEMEARPTTRGFSLSLTEKGRDRLENRLQRRLL